MRASLLSQLISDKSGVVGEWHDFDIVHRVVFEFECGSILDYQCFVAEPPTVQEYSLVGEKVGKRIDIAALNRVQFLALQRNDALF